jgi:hypothetical protein
MNLTTSQDNSDLTTPNSNIKQSLILALERTNTTPFDLSNMISDIESEFSRISVQDIQKAIRKGALGEYGITYKLSTQVVCFWIRQYLESKNKRNLGI